MKKEIQQYVNKELHGDATLLDGTRHITDWTKGANVAEPDYQMPGAGIHDGSASTNGNAREEEGERQAGGGGGAAAAAAAEKGEEGPGMKNDDNDDDETNKPKYGLQHGVYHGPHGMVREIKESGFSVDHQWWCFFLMMA